MVVQILSKKFPCYSKSMWKVKSPSIQVRLSIHPSVCQSNDYSTAETKSDAFASPVQWHYELLLFMRNTSCHVPQSRYMFVRGWDENDGDHLADYTVCLLAKSTDWMTWIPLFHVLISFHGEIFNSSHLPDAFLFVLFFLLLQSCWLLLRRLLLLKSTHLPTHLPSP